MISLVVEKLPTYAYNSRQNSKVNAQSTEIERNVYRGREHKENAQLKGPCHEIFDPRFFSSNNTPWAPDSRTKAFLNSASNSPRYDRFSNAKIVHTVSMTPHARKFFLGSPFKFIYFLVAG
jgi:hypothetical protein